MNYLSCAVVLAILGTAIAFSGEFVPKSFYVIDREGHKSDVVYFRTRRESYLDPLARIRRTAGGGGSSSSASAYSSASASSSSSSGSGPVYFGDGGVGAGFAPNYPQGGYSNLNFEPSHLPQGATIYSRFGEEPGSGVQVTGSAQGAKGAFSSSSTSVDGGTGKVRYSVQSGKY